MFSLEGQEIVFCWKFCGVRSDNVWNKIERMLRNEPTCLEIRMSIRRCDGQVGKFHIFSSLGYSTENCMVPQNYRLLTANKLIICKYIPLEGFFLICQIPNLFFAGKVHLNF